MAHLCMGEEGRLRGNRKGEVVPYCFEQHPLKSDLMQSPKFSWGSMSPDYPGKLRLKFQPPTIKRIPTLTE